MRYNIYINTQSGDYTLGDLQTEDLDVVIDAYNKGLSSFVINGAKKQLDNVIKINVFEIRDQDFCHHWNNDQRETPYSGTYWKPEILKQFGKDVTREFIGNKEFGNQKGIRKVFDSNGFTTFFWNNLNPIVVKVSRERFETKQYADSVEAALKEINDIIKQEYKKITGSEEDGKNLMLKSFSPKNPVFKIADLSDSNGQNIQEGYMHIFEGAMQGIRNPKAHKNLIISEKEAVEKLFLASHLMNIFENRI